MGVFDRFLGKGREIREAKRAELRGDLAKAAELYGLAGAPDEAARVMVLRGDAETDLRLKMQHYTQALSVAPEEHDVKKEARKKRAELVLSQFPAGAASPQVKREIHGAAKDLELAGELARAAEVYALIGDTDGEARALAGSGEVDKLEHLLSSQQAVDRATRARTEIHAEVEMMMATGRRREALAAAERWLEKNSDDRGIRDRVNHLKSRRVLGPLVELTIRGTPLHVVLGDEVTIGRTEGTLTVASHAVSRQHVRIRREGGVVVVNDLGSRNGTQLRGMNVTGALRVEGPTELTLGKEVRLALGPSEVLANAVRVELGGKVYIAPLGPAAIPGTSLALAQGEGGWVELVGSEQAPPFMGETSCVPRTTLLVGDIFSGERSGATVVRIGPP